MNKPPASRPDPGIKFDLNLIQVSVSEMPDRVEQARAAGYDGLFVAETRQDPFLPLAAASATASGLELGTSIALAFTRSPMLTAMSAWEMQRAHGSFVLGLGAQVRKHIERRFSCTYSQPAARLAEYVNVVRHAWGAFQGEHPLEFHGDFYTMDFLPAFANPGPIEGTAPKIFLATVGKRMYRTAGAVADGAFVHPLHTIDYLKSVALPAVSEGARSGPGPAVEQFSLSATVFAIIGSGDEAAEMEQAVRAQLAFYASTPTYRDVLTVAGWEEVGETLQSMVRNGEHAEMPGALPDEMLNDFCVRADTWSEAAEVLRNRYAGVVDRISFYNPPSAGVSIT